MASGRVVVAVVTVVVPVIGVQGLGSGDLLRDVLEGGRLVRIQREVRVVDEAAAPAGVVEEADAHRDEVQQDDRRGQQAHGERVAGGRGDRGEDGDPYHHAAPPAEHPLAADQAGEVQQHQYQRQLEGQAEDEHHPDDEVEEVVKRQQVGGVV